VPIGTGSLVRKYRGLQRLHHQARFRLLHVAPTNLAVISLTPSALLFWASVACCLVAQVLIVRSVLGVRGMPAASPEVPRSHGGVELFWAIVPAVALGVLLLFTWRAIEAREARATTPAADVAR
jgi:heme/copper-type cytochrome/quinol oxidase subunit 2